MKKTEKIKPPKMLKEGHHRCTQSECNYYQKGNCEKCEDCSARPYEIKDSCKRCYNCENVPGSLRWGEMKKPLKEPSEKEILTATIEALKERLKEIEKEKSNVEQEIIYEEPQIIIERIQ